VGQSKKGATQLTSSWIGQPEDPTERICDNIQTIQLFSATKGELLSEQEEWEIVHFD